jgi:hypothetical protein
MKWEYRVCRGDNGIGPWEEERILNSQGKDGWELTSVVIGNRYTWFYFKRAIN